MSRLQSAVLDYQFVKSKWCQTQGIKTGIAAPGVMIASDGMTYAKLAHPRTAGTFQECWANM